MQLITDEGLVRIVRISPAEMKNNWEDYFNCDWLNRNNKKVVIVVQAREEKEVEKDIRFNPDQILVPVDDIQIKLIDGLTECK